MADTSAIADDSVMAPPPEPPAAEPAPKKSKKAKAAKPELPSFVEFSHKFFATTDETEFRVSEQTGDPGMYFSLSGEL